MNRITKLYALCIVLLSGIFGSSVSATVITPPTFPYSFSEDGGAYYLYNIEKGMYLNNAESQGWGTPTLGSEEYMALTVTKESDGYYSFKNEEGLYLKTDESAGWMSFMGNSYNAAQHSWTITAVGAGDRFKIQAAPSNSYYNASQYLGLGLDSYDWKAYNSLGENDNTTWVLVPVSEGVGGLATIGPRNLLYEALINAETYRTAGYCLDYYDAIYANPASTSDELTDAANSLNNGKTLTSNNTFPAYNEVKILFGDAKGYFHADSYAGTPCVYANMRDTGKTASLMATANIEASEATLSFQHSPDKYSNVSLKVYVDGVERLDAMTNSGWYTIELSQGSHVIRWDFSAPNPAYPARLCNVAIVNSPLITVNLLEAGSLGQEILSELEKTGVEGYIKNCHKLKVVGAMNDYDWSIIDQMKGTLYYLDLSEATGVSKITNRCFYQWYRLHTVKLPEGVTEIGESAFYGSSLENITLPSTITTIGAWAFNGTKLKEIDLASSALTNLGASAFSGNPFLQTVSLPASLTTIPGGTFEDCSELDFTLHEGITSIGYQAFKNCVKLHPVLPESLTSIGYEAFYNVNTSGDIATELVIPKNVVTIGYGAFYSTGYIKATLPSAYYKVDNVSGRSAILPKGITTLRLECPTVVVNVENSLVDKDIKGNITLQVPSFIVNSYKLDGYWQTFAKIEGFDISEIQNWVLNSDLILGANDRLTNGQSVQINQKGGLKINGENGMEIGDLGIKVDPNNSSYGRIFSNLLTSANSVTVTGEVDFRYRTATYNRWYYICLPFDLKVSDIAGDAKKAVRYYDGASRADNNSASGNWKNYAADDVIPAGTGFIMNSSADTWWQFPVNDGKDNITANTMFTKPLQANTGNDADASNKGWNLVGNPYQAYYNINKMNFTAPITVRNSNYSGYSAYSIIDDEYALAPNQAFFVQCPEGTTEISFPLEGRQMTSAIASQNNAPARAPQANSRKLVDVVLSNGAASDRTRVVLNQNASEDYEMTCDASKFFGDADVPQIYTLDSNGNQYAINERPLANAIVPMEIVAPADGAYTLSVTRNAAGKVYVLDNEANQKVDISAGEYTFYAEAGKVAGRFCLVFDGDVTGVKTAATDSDAQPSGIYTMYGTYVGNSTAGLPVGVYIIRTGAKANKIIIK